MGRIIAAALLAGLAVAVSCGRPAARDEGRAGAGSETPAEPRRITFGAPIVDPARLRLGDHVGGLVVERIEANRGLDSTYTGVIVFRGGIELTGSVLPHFDSDVKTICFEVDTASAARLPRWPDDVRRPWFCFENDSTARRALGPPEARRRARIVVDRFTNAWAPTDVVNTARLVRVL